MISCIVINKKSEFFNKTFILEDLPVYFSNLKGYGCLFVKSQVISVSWFQLEIIVNMATVLEKLNRELVVELYEARKLLR
jgi:hypothetical protein